MTYTHDIQAYSHTTSIMPLIELANAYTDSLNLSVSKSEGERPRAHGCATSNRM